MMSRKKGEAAGGCTPKTFCRRNAFLTTTPKHIAPPTGGGHPMERRSGVDRRAATFPMLKFLLFRGRRERSRRVSDRHRFQIYDRYSPKIFAEILSILFLSVLDAFFTLYLIGHGSEELNPVMAYFLATGPFAFFTVKYALTCAAVLIFLFFKSAHIRGIGVYTASLFSYVIALFSAVVAWELLLIFFFVS